MTIDVTSEIEIKRWVPEVASFATNPDNVTKWYTKIKSVEWKSPRPLRVGTRIAFTARFLGKQLVYTYEVIEFIPSERLVMRMVDGSFRLETTYTWKPAEMGGTRMTLRNRGEPSGWMQWIKPLVALAMGHANRKDLGRLKTLLERPSER